MTPDLLGQIAQLVEQRIENPRVDSSILSFRPRILSLATVFCRHHRLREPFCLVLFKKTNRVSQAHTSSETRR